MDTYYAIGIIDELLSHHGTVIVEEAQRAGLELALACALVKQESGGRNIFGCDGRNFENPDEVPFCGVRVTAERVRQLLEHIASGGDSNGVGLVQLTAPELIKRAEALGGAHKPRNQLRVGFGHLVYLIDLLGYRKGIGAYNGGAGNPIMSYAWDVLEKRNEWRRRLR
jgi:hypothetical protein